MARDSNLIDFKLVLEMEVILYMMRKVLQVIRVEIMVVNAHLEIVSDRNDVPHPHGHWGPPVTMVGMEMAIMVAVPPSSHAQ